MQRMGLTKADLKLYHHGLTRTHERRIDVHILNLEGTFLRSLTPVVLDGQVVIDADADDQTPTRILTLTFLDPSRSLTFEPDSPSDVPAHRKRLIRVIDSRRVDGIDDWVECVVFTGQLWDFVRKGAEVTVVAHGKERLALGNRWRARTFAKKSKKTTLIRTLLTDAGETNLSIPDLRATLPNRITITRMGLPWSKSRRVARSMDRHLFYDGAGKARLRKHPTKPALVFTKDALLSAPEIRRPTEGVVNTWWIVGGKPKGQKRRVKAFATLPDRHPMSKESLGRNGADHRLVEKRMNPHIKSKAEAQRRARRLRDDGARLVTEYGIETLPFPHLDELDMVGVETDEGRLLVRMRQWTLPLGPDPQPMIVGTIKRVTRARKQR